MSWPIVNLGSVAQINPRLPKDTDESQLVTFLKMASVSEQGELLTQESRVLSETKKGFTYFEKNDILVAKITPCFENGKATLLSNLKTKIGFGSTEFHVIRAHADQIDTKYLFYLVWNKQFRFLGKHAMKGAAGQQRISSDFLKNLKTPLPPLETQKQIAAVLEKADQLRKDCQLMGQALNSLAQSVFFDMFGDPVTNPSGLKKLGLKRVSKKLHDGPFGSNLKTSHYAKSGVQVIRLKNIGIGEFKEGDKAYVSEDHAETLHKFKCYPGEIVIATLGDPNLRACIIPKSVPVSINKADCVHCVVDDTVVNSEYLVEYLNLPSVLHTIQNKLHGQTRTRISSGQLATIDVLIPSLAAQQKYLDVLVIRTQLRDDLKKQRQEYDELFNALMKKAFKGELSFNKSAA